MGKWAGGESYPGHLHAEDIKLSTLEKVARALGKRLEAKRSPEVGALI